MKSISVGLPLLLIFSVAWGAEPVSIEEFKKIRSEGERMEVIDRAPPEQKEELRRISVHLEQVRRWGGEAGLQAAREREVIGARGLGALGRIFGQQRMIWGSYIVGIGEANEDAGLTKKERADVGRKLVDEAEVFSKRLPIVQSLLLNLAASPRALELDKEAEKLSDEMTQKVATDGVTPFKHITTEERAEFDRRIEAIFKEIGWLPKLPPDQVKKELDAMTDDKIHGGSGD